MNIKNHSSSVPVERTVSRIESALAKAGANGIQKDYENGRLCALAFTVQLPTGNFISIRLPANVEAVLQTMRQRIRRPRTGTWENLKVQAERTAWRLMQDWVEVQLSLIAMQQADFIQVFLPFVWDGQRTFYQTLRESGFQAVLPEKCG